jgi:hypothetical protein
VIEVSEIKIDKISCTFDVPEHCRAPIISSMKATAGTKRYLPAYRWSVAVPLDIGYHPNPPKAADSHLLVCAAPLASGLRFGRVEFNPSKISMPDVWDVLAVGFAIDPAWVLAGEVTRCDLCTDITGVAVDELLFFYPKFSVAQTWLSSGKTLYIGDRSSSRRFAIYDKRAQLIATNAKLPAPFKLDIPVEETTRVEFRLRKLPLQLISLGCLSNPFSKLQIVACVPEQCQDVITRLFVLASHVYGVNALLYAGWLKDHTVQLKATLLSAGVSWWNPDSLWESFPQAVNTLLPSQQTVKSAIAA